MQFFHLFGLTRKSLSKFVTSWTYALETTLQSSDPHRHDLQKQLKAIFEVFIFDKKIWNITSLWLEFETTGCFTIVETKRLGTNPGF